jgi:hypothetical protein
MRSTVIGFILLTQFLLSGFLYAQGNLQFNQVVLMEWIGTNPINASTLYNTFGAYPFTVPAGKVLKIESMNISWNRSNMPYVPSDPQVIFNGTHNNEPPMLFLNNTVVHINGEVNQAGITKTQIVWLPAGNYTFYMSARHSNTYVQEFSAIVTAIEFNIIP